MVASSAHLAVAVAASVDRVWEPQALATGERFRVMHACAIGTVWVSIAAANAPERPGLGPAVRTLFVHDRHELRLDIVVSGSTDDALRDQIDQLLGGLRLGNQVVPAVRQNRRRSRH